MPAPKDTSKYSVLYKIEHHPEGVEKKDIPEGHGATHDFLIASLMHAPDGGLSTLFAHRGSDGEPLSAGELFKIWTLFTSYVIRELKSSGEEGGPNTRLDFLEAVWDTIVTAVRR